MTGFVRLADTKLEATSLVHYRVAFANDPIDGNPGDFDQFVAR